MKLKAYLLYAKKAVATAATLEGTAVALGLLNQTQDALITSIIGAVTTTLVFFLGNGPKPGAESVGKHAVQITVDGKPVISLPAKPVPMPNPNPPEECKP